MKKKKPCVLISGGAGFIGSHLVDLLVSEGNEVRVLDNLQPGLKENLNREASLFVDDIRLGTIAPAFKGVDVVYHLAARNSVPRSMKEPVFTHEVNGGGTLNVLDKAKQAGVKRVVFASSSSVYGDNPNPKREDMIPMPKSPYALSKLHGEQLCRLYSQAYGLDTVCLRFFNVYGPRQPASTEFPAVIPAFLSCIKAGKPVAIYGDGMHARDFTYVGDVVRACTLAGQHEENLSGAVFNVGVGAPVTLNELAAKLQSPHGITYNESRAGDVKSSEADPTMAKQCLGWEPKTSLDEGLRITKEWFLGRNDV